MNERALSHVSTPARGSSQETRQPPAKDGPTNAHVISHKLLQDCPKQPHCADQNPQMRPLGPADKVTLRGHAPEHPDPGVQHHELMIYPDKAAADHLLGA